MSTKNHPKSVPGIPVLFPAWLDRWQMKYMNPVVKPVARYLPGTAVIKHRGRKSGKPYETVVTTYRTGDLMAIVLGHGKADWVNNVLAAGEADVQLFRRELRLTSPRIIPAGADGEGLPWAVRLQLRRAAVLVADVSG